QTVLPGAQAIFSIAAFGDQPLSFQWRKDGSALIDGENISGSTASTLSIKAVSVTDSASYSVVVTNRLGKQSSQNAELSVVSLTAPEFVQRTLYSFTGGASGHAPNGLTRGLDGSIYGTTLAGGTSDSGTIFRL